MIASVCGAAKTPLQDVWLALTSNVKNDVTLMLREIRFPREIAAIFVGAALSVSGAIMQGLTRNPLADPGLLGLTAGASAALAITGALIPSANYFAITIACFIGAAIGTLLVFGISMINRRSVSPYALYLLVPLFLHFFTLYQRVSAFILNYQKMLRCGLLVG